MGTPNLPKFDSTYIPYTAYLYAPYALIGCKWK